MSDSDFDDWLIQTAEANRVIDYNSLAALQRAMVADGYMPYSGEAWATYEGQDYAIQGSRIPDSEPPARRVYFAPVGDWDNVQFYSKSTCEPLDENSGQASNNTTVLRLENNYTFNTYGQNLTLDQVLFVKGNTETQIFARHGGKALGRVGWVSDWGESEIVELYFDRPPLNQPPQRFCV